MPCTPGLSVAPIALPSPFTFTPPEVSVDFDIALCCKLPPLPVELPIIPLPTLILNPAVVALLNLAIDKVVSYLNLQPLDCPLE